VEVTMLDRDHDDAPRGFVLPDLLYTLGAGLVATGAALAFAAPLAVGWSARDARAQDELAACEAVVAEAQSQADAERYAKDAYRAIAERALDTAERCLDREQASPCRGLSCLCFGEPEIVDAPREVIRITVDEEPAAPLPIRLGGRL
jgi:hypothetical protein